MLAGEIGMLLIVGFVLTVVTIGAFRFWRGLNEFETNPRPTSITKGRLLSSFVSSMVEILKHSKFGKCQTNRISHYTHLAIFYGFILLMLSAFIAAIYHYAGTDSPYPQTGPVKIVGHTGALLLLAGCTLVIYRRLSKSSSVGKTTYFDWFLIVTLFLVTISGVATEVVRLVEPAAASYWLYLVHLWLMFVLLMYAPFSKGAHLIYRTLAMTYAKQIGREVERPSGLRVEP
jgi:quinone-modifying oxidoreductase subunit QmoC